MLRSTTLAAVALVASIAVAATSHAQRTRVLPASGNAVPAIQPFVQPPAQIQLPRFGFQSYNLQGYGDRVTFVRCHGRAAQMGLEPGDTILSLNGFPLTYHGAWNQALYQAMMQGGSVTLAIQDVRTGMVVYRSTYLGPGIIGNPVGPITPKAMPIAPPPEDHFQNPGNNAGAPKFITPDQVPGNLQPGQPGITNPKFSVDNGNATLKVGKVGKVTIPNLGKLLNSGN